MLNYPPGVTCESVTVRLEHYVMRTLPRGEALALAEHLEACWRCPEQLALQLALRYTEGRPRG